MDRPSPHLSLMRGSFKCEECGYIHIVNTRGIMDGSKIECTRCGSVYEFSLELIEDEET